MPIELEIKRFPKKVVLKDDFKCSLRPLKRDDEANYYQFFQDVPEVERMFIKHRMADPKVIREWCHNIDLNRDFPLLAFTNGKIIGTATLHLQTAGWKRHIGRISVLVLPKFRGLGLARALVTELIQIARNLGLERIEAESLGEQEAAIKMLTGLGFRPLARFEEYVKDMQAITHDYVLMGLGL